MRLLAGLMMGASLLSAATHYLTVAGLGGEPEYEQRFSGWARDLDKILKTVPDARPETLSGADATRARLEAALKRLAGEAKPDDLLVVMLIGHGTFDGMEYKLNLAGPDLTAVELASLLDRIPAKRQLVVNMTSASGASLVPLQKSDRAVITATKSGTEKNATIFARYWVEAMRDPEADTDKNEVVTALEAFRFADQKTAKFYETQKRIATEHALLEDTGKGEGVRTPSAENGQGLLASRFALLRMGAAGAAALTPEKRALQNTKEDLEERIDQLKYRKAAMATSDYRKQLNALLVELAKVQAELDK
ncbi:MAG: hypothetical protein K2X35_06045 [Bryobacteraceae bacterium]|nr:hypothetical protein [Bryobacteraceae bacterium]